MKQPLQERSDRGGFKNRLGLGECFLSAWINKKNERYIGYFVPYPQFKQHSSRWRQMTTERRPEAELILH
jgi:hypothetical protein